MENQVSPEEQQLLLQIARDAITQCVTGGTPCLKQDKRGNLSLKRGCFVTIKKNDALRGCIGNISSDRALGMVVQEMAVAAAIQDPRFYPVKPEELNELDLEISVLSPLKKIASTEEIHVGVHGLYIEKNLCRGVLLPQVATEHRWDRLTFLQQTCLKAGLEKDDWQKEADIYIFSAQVFGDRLTRV